MEEEVCCICLEKLDDYALNLKCRHRFHTNCITKWLKNKTNCPTCRTFINVNYPFLASENIIFRNKIIVVMNDGALTLFKNNIIFEIILYTSIKTIKIGKFNNVIIRKHDDIYKKLYFSNNSESLLFYDRLKEKLKD